MIHTSRIEVDSVKIVKSLPSDFKIPPVPVLDPNAFAKREKEAIKKAKSEHERLGKGVTPEAQDIFDFIART